MNEVLFWKWKNEFVKMYQRIDGISFRKTELKVIYLLYVEKKSYKEVTELVGLTRERIRQIHSEFLRNIRIIERKEKKNL